MTTDWIRPANRYRLVKLDDAPELIAMSSADLAPHIMGLVARVMGPDEASFILVIPNRDIATVNDIAQMLGFSVLDRIAHLLKPTLMPFRHAVAQFRRDGSIRHQVIRTFHPSVLKEVQRLTNRLLESHSELLRQILLASNGDLTSGLPPVPSNFPMIHEPLEARAIPVPQVTVDTSGIQEIYNGLKRHESWRLDYWRDPYMRHLTDGEVMRRGNDIMWNIHQIDQIGRITLDNEDPRVRYWMERFTEILEEANARGISYGDLGKAVTNGFPYPRDSDVPRKVGRCVRDTDLPEGPYLVRYGRLEHIVGAYRFGRIRLGAAKQYHDPSLDPARRDNELRQIVDIDAAVHPIVGPDGRLLTDRVRMVAEYKSDFLVYCTSATLRGRLFIDFSADACLLIEDANEFRARFAAACERDLPGYELNVGRVEYFDPLCISPSELQPIFWKHFRYSYQEEVRFAVLPRESVETAEPTFLTLGSLEGIARLVKV